MIAQNRPETKKKQRETQLRLMASDPMYAEKRCSKSYISGTMRGMRFDSSWELYFMVYCWESKTIKNVERYKGHILYSDKDGMTRKYFPDFVVEYHNGKRQIVEIKGSKKYNNFLEKFNAARKQHGVNYVVVEEKDLQEYGIYFRKESFLKCFYRKYYKEISFFNNSKIDKFQKRIKEWLK